MYNPFLITMHIFQNIYTIIFQVLDIERLLIELNDIKKFFCLFSRSDMNYLNKDG